MKTTLNRRYYHKVVLVLKIAKIILNQLRQHYKVAMYIFGYVILLLIAIIYLFVLSPWASKLNEFSASVLFLFIFSFLSRCYSAKCR
jgi:hypothetical protein